MQSCKCAHTYTLFIELTSVLTMDGSCEIRLILVEIFTASLSFPHSYGYVPTHIHRGTATIIRVGSFCLFLFDDPIFKFVFCSLFKNVLHWEAPDSFCEEMRPSFSPLTYILLNSAEHFLVNCQGKKTGTRWIDSIYDIAIYCCIWEKVFIVSLTALILPCCKCRFPFLKRSRVFKVAGSIFSAGL